MLVLSRKKSEVIVIGGIVRVTIVEVRGDKVRIGIDAPKEVSVHREEVQKQIDDEKTK
jgi:carbon storage regulator